MVQVPTAQRIFVTTSAFFEFVIHAYYVKTTVSSCILSYHHLIGDEIFLLKQLT